jgi:hypothetical protein
MRWRVRGLTSDALTRVHRKRKADYARLSFMHLPAGIHRASSAFGCHLGRETTEGMGERTIRLPMSSTHRHGYISARTRAVALTSALIFSWAQNRGSARRPQSVLR